MLRYYTLDAITLNIVFNSDILIVIVLQMLKIVSG
jgi:hypothetical protein